VTFNPIAGPDSVATLRETFDRTFAEAPSVGGPLVHDLLHLKIESARYALRVTELSALMADTRITPMATPVSDLLGIAAIRGSMLPVYDFGALLGHAREPAPRWIAVAAGQTPVGLAFARLEGHLRVRADAIVSGIRSNAPHGHQVVRLEDGNSLSLVSVASVFGAIANRVRTGRISE
jgi:purine-binding chemotaxis protein CheW